MQAVGQDTASLLDTLDITLRESHKYIDARRAKIAGLKAELARAATDAERYRLTGRLREEYRSFDIDSALYFANEKMAAARRIGNASYISDARMNLAEMSGVYGMYKEALDYIDSVDKGVLDVYQMEYYYHVYRNIYGLMADNCSNAVIKKRYLALTDSYRDSILLVNSPGSFNYVIVKADKDNVHGRYDEAIKILKGAYSKFDNIHGKALLDYSLAMAYAGKGDTANEKRHLILSAINDIRSGIREYTSLRLLAVMLYKEGDVDRAYAYMTRCMDDAAACNSLWRIYEVQKAFPIINKVYHHKLDRQRRVIFCSLVFIILLTLFLAVAILVIKKQMRKVSAARRQAQEANVRLKELNRELSESSHIKEEYIAHYIDQCSLYIDKMDKYRKHLQKVAQKGGAKELFEEIRSKSFIDNELKDFYAQFDDSFLNLFPNFVDDFNNLLVPEQRIRLKPSEKLNTELRIFALIRLGISSSTKIANFLRYSVTTIYNYRVRLRNAAAGDREKFDDAVMMIGRCDDGD
ncbi:MAG TPA: hypothetical protein H9986_02550 [Candidatus Prevotella stercoripullorum]|nr:hypothetical protein [Candidatus Prevotella stercoripullorum]